MKRLSWLLAIPGSILALFLLYEASNREDPAAYAQSQSSPYAVLQTSTLSMTVTSSNVPPPPPPPPPPPCPNNCCYCSSLDDLDDSEQILVRRIQESLDRNSFQLFPYPSENEELLHEDVVLEVPSLLVIKNSSGQVVESFDYMFNSSSQLIISGNQDSNNGVD